MAHGRASLDDPRELDGDTVFEIGSVTKVFTSVLLADMVRRGEVKLTDSVFSYLPPHTSRAREDRTITLADLATHTSGFPLWPSGIPATRDGVFAMATYTRAQLLDYLSTFPVPAEVGQKWSYSNVDAGVLGLALGVRANSSYEALAAGARDWATEHAKHRPSACPTTCARISPIGHDAERASRRPGTCPPSRAPAPSTPA